MLLYFMPRLGRIDDPIQIDVEVISSIKSIHLQNSISDAN